MATTLTNTDGLTDLHSEEGGNLCMHMCSIICKKDATHVNTSLGGQRSANDSLRGLSLSLKNV